MKTLNHEGKSVQKKKVWVKIKFISNSRTYVKVRMATLFWLKFVGLMIIPLNLVIRPRVVSVSKIIESQLDFN